MGGNNGATLSTTVNLTNLLPNHTYYWWVASDCGFSQVVWIPGGSFTTLPTTGTGCWQSASLGLYHSMGLKKDGTLWSWGDNSDGALGDGTTTNRNTPTQVGTAADWVKIVAGVSYSAGIKADGTLWTWGWNYDGQLGDGTKTNRNTPTQVGTATDWVHMATGASHMVALKSDGTLWAWGNNKYGQLGDGTTVNKTLPIQIGTATDWLSVTSGGNHTLAIKTDGTLWTWGDNSKGQLGNGTLTGSTSPIQIGIATDWAAIDGGRIHSIGLKTDGTLWTWGDNGYGQLGDGTTISKNTPTQVGATADWRSVRTGINGSTIAIKTDGTLWTWGYNVLGQLGDGAATNRSTPMRVGTSTDWQSIAAGAHNTLAIDNVGILAISGYNSMGQIGDGTDIQSKIFTSVACPVSNVTVTRLTNSFAVEEASTKANEMKAYPNPVQDILTISFDQKILSVTVYNTAGKPVLTKAINDTQGTLDFSALLSGVYQVKVNLADNLVKTIKIIKR
ncbi:T9SS type A sorting domain-containing protein [Chryseobacterium sp. ISL-6]|uniref:T9SS type A sorting domain-containing protein n=1 Tax=Chryseobacterium sp. ISL-6 TaxID=2819143 RepID=UPI003336F5EB